LSGPCRLAIFDLDGTLIDSREDLAAAANAARAAVGLAPLPLDDIAAFVGDGLARLIARCVPDPARHADALAAFSDHYAAHVIDHTRCYDGALTALDHLRAAGWDLAVATNKPDRFTAAILTGLGILPRLTAWRGGDGPRKPDPGQLTALLAETHTDPGRSWMIGDHHTDIHAGRAAGLRVAYCTWGIGQRGELAVDAVVAAPADLPGALS
jgi:phosphoglycolate phosphatase